VQEKIGQIKGMMSSVTDYILSTHERDAEQHMGREGITIEPVAERSKSRAQAHMMAGAAHNPKFAKKVGVKQSVAKEFNKADTGKDISKLPKKVKKDELDEFFDQQVTVKGAGGNAGVSGVSSTGGTSGASNSNKNSATGGSANSDSKANANANANANASDETVKETTVSGSVATATAKGKSKGSMQFGKGVYESLDRQFTQALNESIAIESTMQECGNGEMAPAITITADGEEAAKLMMLLKLAGLENQIPSACPSCGGSPCGCAEVVDENAPDWPTNTETLAADPNLRTYSGGLNGPKSTGQSTTPVLASQLRRQASMEESVELERNLFKTWQNYKG